MIGSQIADALILVPGPSYLIFSLSKMYGRAMDRGAAGMVWAIASSFSASSLGVLAIFLLGSMVFVLAIGGVPSLNPLFALTVEALRYLYQMGWPLPFFIATWIVGLFFGFKANAVTFGRTKEAKRRYLEGK